MISFDTLHLSPETYILVVLYLPSASDVMIFEFLCSIASSSFCISLLYPSVRYLRNSILILTAHGPQARSVPFIFEIDYEIYPIRLRVAFILTAAPLTML